MRIAQWRGRVQAACNPPAATSAPRRRVGRFDLDLRRRTNALPRDGATTPTTPKATATPTPLAPAPAPAPWFLLDARLWDRIQDEFPRAPWGPSGLLRVAGFSVLAAAAFGAADALWLTAAAPAAADATAAAAADAAADGRASALSHLAREGLLAALLPGAVFVALRPDLDRAAAAVEGAAAAATAAAATATADGQESPAAPPPRARRPPFALSASLSGPEARYWLGQALVTAVVAFPLAEPVLSSVTAHALDVAEGIVGALSGGAAAAVAPLAPSSSPPAASSFAAAVRAAAEAGDWPSVAVHALASGFLAPLWEEVFWRGFFLASLARVAPARAAVAASALGFAALHLSPRAEPSLALLGACCDLLYLRSGGNLAAPLLFHGLWNAGQVAAVALGAKDSFL